MTIDELSTLKFNTPILSRIDDTIWFYDCFSGTYNVKIFKELIDNHALPNNYWSFELYKPWVRVGEITVSLDMILEHFELIGETKNKDLELVKKKKSLVEPYSIVYPNFHMNTLPFKISYKLPS